MLVKPLGAQIDRAHQAGIGAVEPVLQAGDVVQIAAPVRMGQAAVIRADDKHELRHGGAVDRAGGFVSLPVIGQNRIPVQVDDDLNGRILCECLLDGGKRTVVGTRIGRRVEYFADMDGLHTVRLQHLLQLITDANHIVAGVGRAFVFGWGIGESGVWRVAFAAVGMEQQHLRAVALRMDRGIDRQAGFHIDRIGGLVVDRDGGGAVGGAQHRCIIGVFLRQVGAF